MSSKWSYLSRTTPSIGQYLEKLDNMPSDSKAHWQTTSEQNRQRSVCPSCEGLGIIIPSQQSDREFKSSMLVTAPLRELIHSQDPAYPYEALTNQISAKAEIQREKRRCECQSPQRVANTYSQETPTLKKAMDLAKAG